MRWLNNVTEDGSPSAIRPMPRTAIFIGWLHSMGVDWRVDAALARYEDPAGLVGCVPATVVQPLLHLPLDVERIRAGFEDWNATVASATPKLRAVRETSVPPLADILLRPLTGPTRICPAVTDGDVYWTNHQELLAQALAVGRREAESTAESLLLDYPFVVAAMDYPKRRWNRLDPLRKPTAVDSVDRLPDPTEPRRGRPPHYLVPNLAAEILRILPDGRRRSSSARKTTGFAWLKERWAVEVALDLQATMPDHPDADTLRDWFDSKTSPSPNVEDRIDEAAEKLAKYADNRKSYASRGTRRPSGTYSPRLIAPYILPDLGVTLSPGLQSRVPMELALQDELLLEWLLSERFDRMMELVSGRNLDKLTTRSSDGTIDGFMAERFLEPHRHRLHFSPSNAWYRGALAMNPDAANASGVDVEMTGFGELSEVVERWIGPARGVWAPQLAFTSRDDSEG